MKKIVLLDGDSLYPEDISLESFKQFGKFIYYDKTKPTDIISRISDANYVLVNKSVITEEIMSFCPELEYVGITATGYNNVDINSAKKHGIAVCNVPSYSTDAVAQHTFALILEITNKVGLHNSRVQKGKWYHSKDFCFLESPLSLLSGKSIGIIGYGNIGKKVGQIAESFGMTVTPYSENMGKAIASDIVSLHCPLDNNNQKMVNEEFISKMKDGAILINTARGGLIDEVALAKNLNSDKISWAAVDVISEEPPIRPNPLIGIENCIITPHISWMPKETRQNLIDITCKNINSYINGIALNRVDL